MMVSLEGKEGAVPGKGAHRSRLLESDEGLFLDFRVVIWKL